VARRCVDEAIAPRVRREFIYEDRLAGWILTVAPRTLGMEATLELFIGRVHRPVKVQVGPFQTLKALQAALRVLGVSVVSAGESLRTCTLKEPGHG
jgi:hypothetical protein